MFGCRQRIVNKADVAVIIDFLNQIGNYQKLYLSDFVSELEYIPLETGDKCLIGDVYDNNVIVTKSHIFIASQKYCYAFGRDGKFITEIGHSGQGPGEYTVINTTTGIFVDEKRQSLYLEIIPFAILEYSWDGVFRRSIKLPTNKLGHYPTGVFFVRDSLFIGHNTNYSGDQEYHFFLFDISGKIIKTFDNHVKIERSKIIWNSFEGSIKPFRLLENIFVKEFPNDTLYCLNEHDELIPQFVFNLGKYAYTKEKRANNNPIEGTKDVIFIPHFMIPMITASNYIFFSVDPTELTYPISLPKGRVRKSVLPPGAVRVGYYDPDNPRATPLGIYDTVNKTTRLLDTDPFSRMIGLINDLDGGLSFWPFYFNSENELVDIYQAGKMKEYLTEEYFAAHEIRDSQANQKLREFLKTLDEDDNPVVVVGKMK